MRLPRTLWAAPLLFALGATIPTGGTAAEFSTWEYAPAGGEYLFPVGAFDPTHPARDAELNAQHSHSLRAMGENTMTAPDTTGAILRLTILPQRGRPFVFRLTKDPGGFALELKIAWGFASDPGGIETRDRFPLRPDTFLAILEPLQGFAVCAPQKEPATNINGSLWILETLNGPYCVRAYATPRGPEAAALFSAITAPLRALPGDIRREHERLN
ncbi:MAG: hypothetical protein AAF761_01545 [Pseudomonadota bacterium]